LIADDNANNNGSFAKINNSTEIANPSFVKETNRLSTMSAPRSPILTPGSAHKDYNRYKYYSALRTGYKHLTPETSEDFLAPPQHVINSNYVLLHNPFAEMPKEPQKASSIVIIFSCWKTMMGSAVVSMPWAIQQSGMILGMIICFTSFLISFYTCKLIVDRTGNDPDFSDTARKYYGKLPYWFLP